MLSQIWKRVGKNSIICSTPYAGQMVDPSKYFSLKKSYRRLVAVESILTVNYIYFLFGTLYYIQIMYVGQFDIYLSFVMCYGIWF
jgi:hypothetical protein